MKGNPIIWNGEWVEDGGSALPVWNRSYHFGDGLFETFRAVDRRPLFLREHLERTLEGMQRMGIIPPRDWNEEAIGSEIERLMRGNGMENARIRLTISRKGGGAYTPESDEADRSIEVTGEVPDRFELANRGIKVELYEGMSKPSNFLSPFKCTAAPLYVLAKRWAHRSGYDDALILGSEGSPIESASSNLFLTDGRKLITPPVADGCVSGVMRRILMEHLPQKGWKIEERTLSLEDLLGADEFFLTNAVQGIVPVAAFRDQRYFRVKAGELLRALNERAFS